MIYLSKNPPRGITLLISVILTTVVLSVALALLDITYKQVLLASSAKQSQYAFYSADAALECALYWDQKADAFDYTATSYLTNGFSCADSQGNPQTITITPPSYTGSGTSPANSTNQALGVRTTIFSIPCTGGGTQGLITVTKSNTGTTTLFATGYSSCTIADPRRIERGLKVSYGGGGSSGGGGGSHGVAMLFSGSSWTVPATISSITVWAVGGGGGGAGVAASDGTAGSGGGAGGVAYKTYAVSPGGTVSYTVGAPGGAGSAGGGSGSPGGSTSVTYGGVTIMGTGGQGGIMNGSAGAGGTSSGGDGGSAGGAGIAKSGDIGAGGGGAIGGGIGSACSSSGCIGGQSVDVAGLQAAVATAGYSWTAPGAGGNGSSPYDAGHDGQTATGFGTGGGGAGWYGGIGGDGLLGGGGGGASGGLVIHAGGNGGAGVVVISY